MRDKEKKFMPTGCSIFIFNKKLGTCSTGTRQETPTDPETNILVEAYERTVTKC
jgi:hypothetical protein